MVAGETLLALGIEASNPSAEGGAQVALARLTREGPGWGVEVCAREGVGPSTREGDDLLPAIDRLARQAGVSPGEVGLVAVSVGPGGYTAVRSAVAAGAGVALATGARCAGVGTERGIERAMRDGRPMAVGLASKRGRVWVRAFSGRGEALGEGAVLDAMGVAALGASAGLARLAVDRFCPEGVREACAAAGVEVVEPIYDAGAVLEVAAAMAWTGPEGLMPVYPREPEAVRVWRAR